MLISVVKKSNLKVPLNVCFIKLIDTVVSLHVQLFRYKFCEKKENIDLPA